MYMTVADIVFPISDERWPGVPQKRALYRRDTMKVIRLHIQYHADRERIIPSLANSGYHVWVEEEKDGFMINYYVCFEMQE
jgi:hypothetical protein